MRAKEKTDIYIDEEDKEEDEESGHDDDEEDVDDINYVALSKDIRHSIFRKQPPVFSFQRF